MQRRVFLQTTAGSAFVQRRINPRRLPTMLFVMPDQWRYLLIRSQ